MGHPRLYIKSSSEPTDQTSLSFSFKLTDTLRSITSRAPSLLCPPPYPSSSYVATSPALMSAPLTFFSPNCTGWRRSKWPCPCSHPRQEWRPCPYHRKDTKYHVGQRGAGIQPRSQDIYGYLGTLPDVVSAGRPNLLRCIYEMPGGTVPAKIYDMTPFNPPTPSVPNVSLIQIILGTMWI